MDVRKFVLSYYENAAEDFHINEITHPRGALSLHSHEYYQIYYLKSGKIIHHLEASTAELVPGDVFIIPPELIHYIEPSSENLRFYSISFMPSFLDGIEESNKLIRDFTHWLTTLAHENLPPSFSLGEKDTLLTDQLISSIMYEFSENKTGNMAVIKAAMGLLLSVFARAYLEERCEDIRIRSDKDAITHCMGYIENHLDEQISLEEMARRTAMSKTAFCKAFFTVTGETFNKCLNRKRVEKAAALIRQGEGITRAAMLSGYYDFTTFYRNFRRIFGVSPSEYASSASRC